MQSGSKFIPYGVFVGLFIPNALAQYTKIQLSSKLIWGRLAQYGGENGDCFPRISSLATELGCSERTIKRGIKELKDNGFIEVEKVYDNKTGRQKTNRYHFLWHTVFDSALCKKEVASKGMTKSHGGDVKKSHQGGTSKSPSLSDNMTSKENQYPEESQKETTTTYHTCCSLSERCEKALKVVAETKKDPSAYEADIRIRAMSGKLNEELLIKQAESININSLTAYKDIIQNVVDRDGLDILDQFVSSVKTPMVTIEGVSLDVEYVKQIIGKLKNE